MSEQVNHAVNKEIVHPIFPTGEYEKPESHLIFINWWWGFIFLIFIFVIIKKFIYIPDDKRKDQ